MSKFRDLLPGARILSSSCPFLMPMAARRLGFPLAAVALAGLALVPPAAFSQAPGVVQEIIVTARKKEEALQDVPVSISAFTAEAIEAAGIRDLYDVAELTPGLSFFNAQGEFLAVPVIRGVAPTDIFGENNAAIFVDGVYVSGREGLNFSQLDLERIEVVKGPQSALYGRNAFSGAINYVSKLPGDEFGAKSSVTLGTDGRQGGQASVTGPLLGDSLRGRVSVLYDEFDGTYDNPLGGQDIGGYRYRSTQASLLWEPSDNLRVVGAVYYSNDEIDDAATTALAADCEPRVDTNLAVVRLLNVCGKLPDLDAQAARYRAIGAASGNPTTVALTNSLADALAGEGIPKIARALGEDRELTRSHLTVDWDLPYGSLTFLTGYSWTEQRALVDGNRSLGDQLPFVYCTNTALFAPGTYLCGGNTPRAVVTTGLLQIEQKDITEEISQEIRFNSPQDGPFRYSVGGYYYDVTSESGDGGVEATTGDVPPFPSQQFGPFVGPGIVIGDAAFRPWFRPGGDLDPLNRPVLERDTKAWSLFGSSELDVTDQLTLDFQLRYGEEEKDVTGFVWNEEFPFLGFPIVESESETFDAVTYRIGGKFKLNESWMIYASWATGEKSGGFDVNSISTTNDPDTPENEPSESYLTILPFDNETIAAAEIGLKGTSADGRLAMDLAIFRNNWDDIVLPEVLERDPITGDFYSQPESFNFNAGDATVLGWELTLSYQVTDNLSAILTTGYTDATWDDARQGTFETFPSFRPADCQAQVDTTTPAGRAAEADCQARSGHLDGNKVLRQPEWDSSFTLAYKRGLSNDWEFFARADASYQSKVYIGNDNQSFLPAHTYVNFSTGIESGRYTIELWGRNVFDDDGPIAAYRDVFFTNTSDYFQQNAPASPSDDFFPFRYTVTHPRLATFGLTAKVRFGGEEF